LREINVGNDSGDLWPYPFQKKRPQGDKNCVFYFIFLLADNKIK
jgi:hypothetical protein